LAPVRRVLAAALAAAPPRGRLGLLRLLRADRRIARGPVPGDRGLLAGGAVALQLHAAPPALHLRHGGRLRAAGQQRLRLRAHRAAWYRARLRERLRGREVPDRVERPPVPALRAAGV